MLILPDIRSAVECFCTQTGLLPAYNNTSLVPLSNGQLMVSTGTNASNTDLAHTTSTKAVKAACEDCWHAMI